MKNFSKMIELCRNALKPPAAPVVDCIEKFTDEEAAQVIIIAEEERRRSANQLRVGQSIWNVAHDKRPELMNSLRGGKYDFFHFRDPYLAIEAFTKYYVESE